MNYTQHPLSAAFPAMSTEEFNALKDSIHVNGVLNPITTFEGMVIDGWHRYTAALSLGMDCPSLEMDDAIDPKDFVLAQNKNRRHITLAQLLASASKVYQWRPNGGDHSALNAECITSAQMAEKTGASVRTVEQFRSVERKASPEVMKAVESGRIGLPKAAEIAKLPKQQQAKAIDKPLPKAEKFTQPVHDTSADELQESAQAIESLSEEVEVLKAELAVKHMDATGEEKSQAATLIAQLRAELKTANAELDAMRASRDGLQRENRELMKQCAIYQRQLKQAQKV